GLKRLEYRGYDSSGVAILNENEVHLQKATGKLAELEARLRPDVFHGTIGIAHTRWATHGKPSVPNAHPHFSCDKKIYVIHNGIIENFVALRAELKAAGHHFVSETDTEVLAHLIETHRKEGHNLTTAVQKTLRRVKGTFGIAVLDQDQPGTIVVSRRGSPLILGIGVNEIFAASDVAAFVRLTKQVVYLGDNEVATIKENDYSIVTMEDHVVERAVETVDITTEQLEKKGYAHYMLKEIHEQPEAVVNAVRGRLLSEEGVSRLGGIQDLLPQIKEASQLSIISCGTSYYAGLYAQYVFEALTNLKVDCALASEFRYRSLNLKKGSVVIAISQSGETSDTMAAVREAKRKGALVLSIVNVVGSSIARETGAGVYMYSGPEIGVASTKCFLSQSIILVLMALLLGRYDDLSYNEGLEIIHAIEKLPEQIQTILKQEARIKEIAQRYARYNHILYIGRKFNYPIALEGALKLKEISYIHAEGYAAGEMKHGPIALIDKDFPTIAIAPKDETYEKMVSNIQEIRAREGKIIAVASEGDFKIREHADDVIFIPSTLDLLTPMLAVIPLQLFAYYCALERGCEIDRPRNLAKSVTVE
ncbi:MAG: glutamine--fructose-6-phosphate transaminase (isomerizing), partial [Elusimicrobia bacterium]|nr:glutamine--fructose-6-phosphate transaminase (isomerizing) [Elusimicrobiota bacterium]